jgi:hypothetical protein
MPRYRHVVMLGALILSGWPGVLRPQTMTLEQAMQRINAGLGTTPRLSESDLLSDERGHHYQAARNSIRDKQCSSGTANPLLQISLPIKINLKGSVEPNGSVRIFGPSNPEADQSARQSSEAATFDIPVRFSTLADLPNEYLKERVALVETKGLPDEVAKKLRKEIPEAYEKLSARVLNLMNTFDPWSCRRPVRARWGSEKDAWIPFIAPTF